MDKSTTEAVMGKLDIFQSRFEKKDGSSWWDLRKVFSRCRYKIFPRGVQRKMPNPWCSFCISSSVTSVNERTSQSDMESVTYNCTLTYDTCESLVSVY